jgi:integrase/recombinase XerD
MSAVVVSKNEEKTVLSSISKHTHAQRNRVVFLLALYSGLRACEISSLLVNSVYEANGSVKASIKLSTQQTKLNKSRVVPINQKLANALIAYYPMLQSTNPKAPLIRSQKQTKFSANGISILFMSMFKKANLSNFTAHSLRHTFITRLANNAISIKAIQKLAGHQHLSSTQKYLHVTDDQLVNAVNSL